MNNLAAVLLIGLFLVSPFHVAPAAAAPQPQDGPVSPTRIILGGVCTIDCREVFDNFMPVCVDACLNTLCRRNGGICSDEDLAVCSEGCQEGFGREYLGCMDEFGRVIDTRIHWLVPGVYPNPFGVPVYTVPGGQPVGAHCDVAIT